MDNAKHQQFAQRLVRNQNKVFRYIVSLVANRADAEELFQQTCLTLWEQWDRYDFDLDFLPWACGIAHNHVRNHLRKRENSQVLLDNGLVEQLRRRSLERQNREDNRQEALLACLGELSDTHRTMVETYYGGEQSVEQIAHSSASTPNAVYKTLRRIRMMLYDCISKRLAAEASS